jgi:hypothetical protein
MENPLAVPSNETFGGEFAESFYKTKYFPSPSNELANATQERWGCIAGNFTLYAGRG